ncbi:MAG: hypothetical protein KY461_06340 [Actinobacteria bacterium]|nr:hypothetical protein [Actinomycetota bacterium]
MSTVTLSAHNVVAAFRDLELADDSLAALREAGFDDDEISLLGRPVEEVEREADDGTGPGEPVGGSVIKQTFVGGAAGGLAGGAIGALATAAVAAIPGVGLVAGTGALLGFLGGAGGGATVGSILEGESALRTNHSWAQALDAIKEGALVVGVHGTDTERIAEAERILSANNPMDVRRVDSRGETVTTDR